MKKLFTVIAIGVLLTSCGEKKTEKTTSEPIKVEQTKQTPEVSPETTKSVIEHHLQAFGKGDMKALLEDYTEESVVITPEAKLKGLAQIEELFTKLGSMFPAEGTKFNLIRMDIENELGYIIWDAQTPIVNIPLGTDTYIVEDGKIMVQTFAAKVEMVTK